MMKYIYIILIILFLASCASRRSPEMAMSGEETEGQIETFADPRESEITHETNVKEDIEPIIVEIEEMEAMAEPPELIITESSAGIPAATIEPDYSVITAIDPEPVLQTTTQIIEVTHGDITYLIQDTMIVGEINIVNLTVSNGMDVSEVIDEVETFTEDNVHTEIIRIAPVMKARLIDITKKNFEIIPITPEEQFLEINTYTKWMWNVIPLTKGNHKLTLSVDIVIDDKGKTIEVYDDFIYVYSTQSVFSKIWEFGKDNWQWFSSSILLPIFYFLFRYFKRKKKKE